MGGYVQGCSSSMGVYYTDGQAGKLRFANYDKLISGFLITCG